MSEASNKDFPRRVVIDDTDTRIQYSPTDAWSLDKGSFDDRGNYGPPHKDTMHGTNKSGASLSFTFEGDYILVRGAQDIRSNGKPPTWTCSLDGNPIPVFPFRDANRITHVDLCELTRISRRSHTLTVNVTINDPTNQMFWLDYLEYAPLEDVNLDGNTLKIDSSDARVRYNNGSAQWRELSPQMNGTGVSGGSLSFKFNGTSVSLYTFLEGSEQDWSSSPARYHIDDADDTSFTIPASKRLSGSGNRSDFFNQLLFTSPNLSPGEHELTLSFDGVSPSGGPPIQWLIIDYFHVIAAGTNLSRTPVSVIVGAVVGGVVGLLVIGLAAYFLMKRHRKNRRLQGSMNSPWSGGASGSFGLGNNNHNYAAVTPFIPEEDSTRSTFYDPWDSSMSGRPKTSTANVSTTNTYPPEKSRHRLTPSTSSSAPLTSSSGTSATPLLAPNRQVPHVGPPTVLPSLSPPNASAGNTPYLDPFADFVPDSNASTRPTMGTQSIGTSNVIHVRHEDSGIRLPRGNDSTIEDLPPDYTRD